MWSGGPQVHAINAQSSSLRPIQRTTIGHVTCILKIVWDFSPTREKLKSNIGFIRSDILRG